MATPTTLTVEPVGEDELLITRVFEAPRALVFDAHTRPDLVRRWMLGPGGWTMPVCEIDLRPGGSFRYVWRKDGKDMGLSGTFREIVPPSRIVHTEIFDQDWTGGETLVTTTFEEAPGRTTLAIRVRYSSGAARAAALGTGMTQGMSDTYDRLAEMLGNGEAVSDR
jgi:uncharacterized protein YndB with AHSA1/START domain